MATIFTILFNVIVLLQSTDIYYVVHGFSFSKKLSSTTSRSVAKNTHKKMTTTTRSGRYPSPSSSRLFLIENTGSGEDDLIVSTSFQKNETNIPSDISYYSQKTTIMTKAEDDDDDKEVSKSSSIRETLKNTIFLGVDPTPDVIAIATIYFVEGALGLARLAQTFLLKDELHLGPAELSACEYVRGRRLLLRMKGN